MNEEVKMDLIQKSPSLFRTRWSGMNEIADEKSSLRLYRAYRNHGRYFIGVYHGYWYYYSLSSAYALDSQRLLIPSDQRQL